MKQLAKDLVPIYELEISLGNQVARIDDNAWTECPLAVHLVQPLHVAEIQQRLVLPATVAYWECHDPHYELEAGYRCASSRHSIAGPLQESNRLA